MKKMILLLTILCASQLYSMEKEKGNLGVFEQLPKELHQEIVENIIASSNTVDEAIKAIDALSILKGLKYNNLTFIKLMHTLSDKFNLPTKILAEQIINNGAKHLTSLAINYIEKSCQLNRALQKNDPNLITKLINDGADINFSSLDNEFGYLGPWKTLLQSAIDNATKNPSEINQVKLFLKYGAKPRDKDLKMVKVIILWGFPVETGIVQLIEEAIKNESTK